jgi:hypothetical protein
MSLADSNMMVITMLQMAKSHLDLLIQMAASNTSTEVMATMADTFTKTVDGAMKIRQTIETSASASVVETASVASVEEDVPDVPAEDASVGKTWSVHDCHTYHKKGEWVATAITDGQYGIGIAPTFGSKDSSNEKIMGPLGEVTVSKRRWAAAKSISVGDTLFMGDTYRKKVYKGLVTAQPVAGPFCPLSSPDNSFRMKFAPLRLSFEQEVEVSFKVDWTEVSPLTDEWKDYLGTKRLVTVSPLKGAPPA